MQLGSLLSPSGSLGGLTHRLSGPLLDSDPGGSHARAGGLAIEFRFGKHVELLVRRLLLLQVRLQKAKDVVMAKLFRPGDQCPVAGNLTVTLPFRCGLRASSSGEGNKDQAGVNDAR